MKQFELNTTAFHFRDKKVPYIKKTTHILKKQINECTVFAVAYTALHHLC